MAKGKYDWVALKKEFLASDYLEAKVFIEDKLGIWHASAARNVTGWGVEKDAMKLKAYDKSIIKIEKAMECSIEQALKNIVKTIARKTLSEEEVSELKPSEIKALWEIIRTENGLPSKITENKNLNENRDVVINEHNPYDPNEETGEGTLPPGEN